MINIWGACQYILYKLTRFKEYGFIFIVIFNAARFGSNDRNMIAQKPVEKYEADWKSLAQCESPEWFEDAVFGIYCHRGLPESKKILN